MREAGGATVLAARPAPLPTAATAAARHRSAADPARLQLREALAGLASPDLQQQSVFAAETLLTGADAAFCDWAVREVLRAAELVAAPASARRLRYRLAARALAARPSGADWGNALVMVRDRLVDSCSVEDHAPAAAQMAVLAQQLAASCIDAYCRGCYASLGCSAASSKADLPRDWLSQLLLQPLLRAACRGPARTLAANACLLVHAVLGELGSGRWAKSAGVLHAAVDCLKHALKLTGSGALALCAGEALLPLQACVTLLGPRLKLAALEGILLICTRAMQRSEWAVRKAAADSLAQLAETLLAAGSGAATNAAGQQQGLAALEALAPDMAAAVEEHLKYDRIPQVRQAAAAALQLLGRVPGMPLQQAAVPGVPAQPVPRPTSAAGQAPAVPAAVAALRGAAAGGGLGQARSNLQAIIAERRKQLQDAGWNPGGSANAEVQVYGGQKAAAAGMTACRASSSGSADEAEGGAWTGGHIRAWAGDASADEQEAQHAAAADAGDAMHEHAAPRPPSAAAFHSAAEALQWLDGEPAQQAAKKRRGWGSRPASPAKQGGGDAAAGGHDVPVQIYAPPVPPAQQQQQQQQQVWRENPLAASTEAPGRAALAPAASTAVPCTHHVQHPQFSLRLQAAPPEAQLCLPAAGTQQAANVVHSVRFWAGSDGADVGIEFGLAADPGSTPGRHRYWLCEGQLMQEKSAAQSQETKPPLASPPRAAPAAAQHVQSPTPAPAAPAAEAAAGAAEAQALSPAAQHTPQPSAHVQQQRQQQQDEGQPTEAAAEQVPFESPLASLATAALPSFSPEKQPAAQQRLAASSPRLAATPSTAAVGWAQPGASPRASPRPQSPAGQRSSSPDNQQRASAGQLRGWAASLRPPGEQRLAGLPDWDRSRPESPLSGAGGITHGAGRAGSKAGSRAGSQPGSRAGSRPGSPTRRMQVQSPGGSRPASPGPATAASAWVQQEAEPADGGKAAGPLTVMVRRAVSKLQQLHELEEELQLPAAGIQPSSGAPQLGGANVAARQQGQQPARYDQQPQQRQPPPEYELRRSLEPVLSAIKEAHSEEGSQGASSHRSSRQGGGVQQVSDGRSGGSARSRASSAAQQQEAGRLQRLQDQLAANMQQIQRRLDGQQEGHSAHSPRSPASAASPAVAGLDTCERGSSGESGMPAAWDEQEALPAPGQRRYAQLAAQEAQQAASACSSPASSCGDGDSAGGYQDAHALGSGSSGVVMAVSNPLFGSSRPGTAEGLQNMQEALLPPKRSLRRQRSSQGESGSPRLERHEHRQQQQQQSAGMGGSLLQASLGSLGSGFGVLHWESEAEVQQFLRGSLAAPRRQQQPEQPRPPCAAAAAALAPAPAPAASAGLATRSGGGTPASQSVGSAASSHLLPSGRSASHTPAAAGGQAAVDARWVGSIDLGAILGESRPASPGKSPLLQLAQQLVGSGSSSEGDGEQPWMTARSGGWHTARSGPAPDGWRAAHSGGSAGGSAGWQARAAAAGWLSSSEEGSESSAQASQQHADEQQQGGGAQAAVAELQLLRISSRSPSPPRRGHGSGSHGRAGSASLSDVVQQTFPPQAVERLERLREQLSPSRQQRTASPPQAASHSRQSGSIGSGGEQAAEDAAAASGAAGSEAASGSRGSSRGRGSSSRGSGRGSSSRQGSLAQQLPKRCNSPELPGLHITLHQAKLLQSAVGRMPGNPGESADAPAIQEALMDVLSGWTLHVQKHYQRAAAEQLAAARRRHGGDAAAVQREGQRLEAAREAAVRDELSVFVEQTLPRLAEVLSSRELLLQCFEAAAEQDEEAPTSLAHQLLAPAPERRRPMQAAVVAAVRSALAVPPAPAAAQRCPTCVLCHGTAAVYCRNDDAFLCTMCDAQMHSASTAGVVHERCPAAALLAPACAPSESAAVSTLPTPTAQQLRHAASLETLGDPQSARSVSALQPAVPPSAAATQAQVAQLQAAHQQLLLQHAYPSYGPAVSLRPAGAPMASTQVSPFCFYTHRPLAPPPPLPTTAATPAAAPRWAPAAGVLPRSGRSNEDLTRWEGRAPAAHASSLDEELMECLAGLNSDPSSQLECAPLDLSRPLPMDPLDAVALGSGDGGAAEGGHAAPSDGSGGSENLDEALAATMSVASTGSRPGSAPESPSGLPPPGQSGVWLHYPPSGEAHPQLLVREAAPPPQLVVVPQPAPRNALAAERDALAMAAGELGRQAQLVTTGGALLSQTRTALAAVVTSGSPAKEEQAALAPRQPPGDARGAAPAGTPRSGSAAGGRPFSPMAIRVTVHRGGAAAPKRPASAAAGSPRAAGGQSPKRARTEQHRHRPTAAEAAVAALAAACGGGNAAPPPPTSPRAAAAAAKLAKAERWAAKGVAVPQEGSPRKRGRATKRPRPVLPQLTAEQIAAIVIPPYREGETRADKLARYRAKKLRRSYQKKVRYECRKHYADVRPRIKGRFVSPEEFAAWQEAKAAGRADSEAIC